MKTIFVTGAEGFAGQHVTQYLRQRGYDVVAGVRNRGRKLAYERNFGKALVCEIGDPIGVARAIASVRPDGVIHLASTTQPAHAANDPLLAYQTIVNAWANLLDAVRRSVPRARVLMVSACEVYGDAGNNGQALTETAALRPVNVFGAFKAAAEQIAHAFYDNYHLNVTIARPFHFTGANQGENFFFGSVARQIAQWSAGQGPNIELPDLHCRRELLHVLDVAAAFETILTDGQPNQVYNVSAGAGHTVRELVEQLIKLSGRPLHLVNADEETANPVQSLCGGNQKLTGLGWQPQRSTEQALRDLYHSWATSNAPAKPAPTPALTAH